MARRRPRPRGWYVKPGDPPGMERFWDGEKWGPEPRRMKNPPADKKSTARSRRAPSARQKAPVEAPEVGDMPVQGTIWERITARSTDALLLIVPWYFLLQAAVTIETVVLEDGAVDEVVETNEVYLLLVVLMLIAYEVGFTGSVGWTPGKRLVGLVVATREDMSTPPGWGKALMRSTPLLLMGTLLAVFIVPILWLASVIAMRLDGRQRSVFDFLGGTVVIRRPTE